jgi:hypothetical protein
MNEKSGVPILSIVLYALAILMLLAAGYVFINALGFSRAAADHINGLSQTLGPVAGLLADGMNRAAGILGVLLAGLVLTVSALLFTAGQMLIHERTLSNRIKALEKRLSELNTTVKSVPPG